MKKERIQLFLPFIFLLVFVNGLSVAFKSALQSHNIDTTVVIVANFLLFFICIFSINKQIKSMNNINPHAMVRVVMSSVVIKLFVLGTAAFVYLYISGETKSVNALFISMALYLIYTWLEVKISLRLNPSKNGGN